MDKTEMNIFNTIKKDMLLVLKYFDVNLEQLDKPYWKEALCSMYHSYCIGSYSSSYMNLFSAFEGYICSKVPKINEKKHIYFYDIMKNLLNELDMESDLKKFKEFYNLTNSIVHGMASPVKDMDIIKLLVYFTDIYNTLEEIRDVDISNFD